MDMADDGSARGGRRHTLGGVALMVLVVAALLYAFNLILNDFILKQYSTQLVSYQSTIVAVVVLAAGYALITLLGRVIMDVLVPRIGMAKAVPIKYSFTLIAYLVLAFAVFGTLHLDLQGLIVGSAFTAIVLGLASQTVLANFFAGLVLVLARPVSAGERITFSTWQFGVLAPSYPPKFYSSDFLVSGFTGTVDYVGFLYVDMVMDDGRLIKVPAGIFIQALILVNSRRGRMKVRAKYEVDRSLDPAVVIDAVVRDIARLKEVMPGTEPVVLVSETTASGYVISIDIQSESQYEEPVRSEMLRTVMKTVTALKSAQSGRQ